MKYQEWLEYWLNNYIEPTLKYRTYKRYQEIVKLHLIPNLGRFELNKLTPFTLQSFVAKLLNCGNLKTGKGLSANSVNSIITVLQTSLKTAYSLDYIEEYTANKIKRPKMNEKKVDCLSYKEQKKLELEIMSRDKPKYFGILLCLYTGLRIGELLALEWSDIDFLSGEVQINKSCYDGKNFDGVFARITDTPKTVSSIRVIPLPKSLIPFIREAKRKSLSKYVVSNAEKTISIRSYQRTFVSIQKKLKIPCRGFHCLRHTFATRALECGMDVKTLSEILGHKSPTVTLNRYVHSLMEHKKEMMNRLGKLL